MLDATIRLALRYRTLVVVLSLAVLGYGSYAAATLPIDVFPDLDRPRVMVMAECPGLAPEEVRKAVRVAVDNIPYRRTLAGLLEQTGRRLVVIPLHRGLALIEHGRLRKRHRNEACSGQKSG